jgi:ABC-type Fe3+ transport system permease subunit
VRTNPTLFLVIAYGIRRLPYMVRSAVAGLQQTSVTLEEAAANLGASPFKTTCAHHPAADHRQPDRRRLLAFAFSMLEVSDSLMLAQREDYYPITKTIYELFQLIGTGKYIASGARRLGHDVPRRHHHRQQPHPRQEDGRDFPGVIRLPAQSLFGRLTLTR